MLWFTGIRPKHLLSKTFPVKNNLQMKKLTKIPSAKSPPGQKPSRSEALPVRSPPGQKPSLFCLSYGVGASRHLFTSGSLTDIGVGAVSFVEMGRLHELGAGLEPFLPHGWLPVNRLALAHVAVFRRWHRCRVFR